MKPFRLVAQKIVLSESDVAKACVDLLRWKHLQPLRIPTGRYIMPDREVIEVCQAHEVKMRWINIGAPGMPDYVIPRWCMEVKRPGGKLSDDQKLMIMDLERTYYIPCAVVESVDELIQWLKEHPEVL